MEYKTIFKCRLCGECYEGWCKCDKKHALQAARFACMGTLSSPETPHLIEVHNCKNGDIGIADFRGFRKVEKK